MIERVTAYKSSDGATFASLEEIQKHELMKLLGKLLPVPENQKEPLEIQLDQACMELIKQKQQVIDILTTGPRSKPKARSINGGTKRRGSRSAATAVNTQTPAA